MVYRVCVEKKPGLAPECASLLSDCRSFLDLKSLENVRIWNRYDVEGIDETLFAYATNTVFSEPQLDLTSGEIDASGAAAVFAVEPASSTSARTARRSASSSSARASARASARRRSMRSTARFPMPTLGPLSAMSSTPSRAARPRLQSPKRSKRTSPSPSLLRRLAALSRWMNRRSRRFFCPWALRWT